MQIATYWQNYIGGAWVEGEAGRLTVEDPASGEARWPEVTISPEG